MRELSFYFVPKILLFYYYYINYIYYYYIIIVLNAYTWLKIYGTYYMKNA